MSALDRLIELGDVELFRALTKHGDHDQSTHGRRDGGGDAQTERTSALTERISSLTSEQSVALADKLESSVLAGWTDTDSAGSPTEMAALVTAALEQHEADDVDLADRRGTDNDIVERALDEVRPGDQGLRAGDTWQDHEVAMRSTSDIDPIVRLSPFNERNLERISEFVSRDGFQTPLILNTTPAGKEYLYDGNHRLEVANRLGIEEVPIVVATSTEEAHDLMVEAQRWEFWMKSVKHGDHDQSTHGNRDGAAGESPKGEFTARNADEAWTKLDADRYDQQEQEKAHPENYEPNRGYGVHLKEGATEWHRDVAADGSPTIYQVIGTDQRTIPIEDRAAAGLPSRSPEGVPIVDLKVEGSDRPDPYVYRMVSVGEFEQAQERGYFQSNQSMNLADEGTVASRGSTGTFYAPVSGEEMRVVQIDMDPADGWKVDDDGYVKTPEPIPFERAAAYSTPLPNPRAAKSKHGDHDQSDHGNRGGGGAATLTPGQSVEMSHPGVQAILAETTATGLPLVRYSESLDSEARTESDGRIVVGDKFFDLPAEGQVDVLQHEYMHSLGVDDEIVRTQNWDDLLAAGKFSYAGDDVQEIATDLAKLVYQGDDADFAREFPELHREVARALAGTDPKKSRRKHGDHNQSDHGNRDGAAAEPTETRNESIVEKPVQTRGGYALLETVSVNGTIGEIRKIGNTREGAAGSGEAVAVVRFPDGNDMLVDLNDNHGSTMMDHVRMLDVPDDGSGRTYMMTYGSTTESYLSSRGVYGLGRDAYYDKAEAYAVAAVERNHTLEEDSGLTNTWSGEIHIGVDEEGSAVGTKNWECTISFDENYIDRVGRDRDNGGVSAAEAAMVSSHELAHGLSNGATGISAQSAYKNAPGYEEGVVQGYVESLAQVEYRGRDSLAGENPVPGTGSYSKWVTGLDEGLRIIQQSKDEGITAGDRLDFYRDLLNTRLPQREDWIDEQIAGEGFDLDLTGHGLDSEMSYTLRLIDEKSMRVRLAKEAPRSPVHALIFTARTPEEARKILPEVAAYLRGDPADWFDVARDAEALLMFATSDVPVTRRKHGDHDQSTHGNRDGASAGTAEKFPEFGDPYAYTDASGISWRDWTPEEVASGQWLHDNLGPGPGQEDEGAVSDALRSYIEGPGMADNMRLRDGIETDWSRTMDEAWAEQQPTPVDLTVTRGTGMSAADLEALEVGGTFVPGDGAHTSASMNEGVARFFGSETTMKGETTVLLEIDVPEGSRGLMNMSSTVDEGPERWYPDEVLLRADTPVQIDSIEHRTGLVERDDGIEYVVVHGTAESVGKKSRKHGDHDQSTHGNRGGGSEEPSAALADQARTLNSGEPIDPESDLGQAILARTGGEVYDPEDHEVIVDAIQASAHDAPVLYRGFPMNESNGWSPEQIQAFTSQLEPGATITMRLGSYTSDPAVVQEFAGVDSYLRPTGGVGSTMPPVEGGSEDIMADIARAEGFYISPTGTVIQPDDQRVIVAVQPGAQALNLQPNAAPDFAHQAEYATLGHFVVESVQRSGPVWKVQVSQVDSVEAATAEGGDADDRQTL